MAIVQWSVAVVAKIFKVIDWNDFEIYIYVYIYIYTFIVFVS